MSISLSKSDMTTNLFQAGNVIYLEDFNDASGGLQFNVKKELRIIGRHIGGNFVVRRFAADVGSGSVTIDGFEEGDKSFEPTLNNPTVDIHAGTIYINGVRYTTGAVSLNPSTAAHWLNGAMSDGDYYVYARASIGTPDTAGFYWSAIGNLDMTTAWGHVLLAKITVSGGNCTAVTDMRSKSINLLDAPQKMVYDTTGDDSAEQNLAAFEIVRRGANTGAALLLDADASKVALKTASGKVNLGGDLEMNANDIITTGLIDTIDLALHNHGSGSNMGAALDFNADNQHDHRDSTQGGAINFNTYNQHTHASSASGGILSTPRHIDLPLAQWYGDADDVEDISTISGVIFPQIGASSEDFGVESKVSGGTYLRTKFRVPEDYSSGGAIHVQMWAWGGAQSVRMYYSESAPGSAPTNPSTSAGFEAGNGTWEEGVFSVSVTAGYIVSLRMWFESTSIAEVRVAHAWFEYTSKR